MLPRTISKEKIYEKLISAKEISLDHGTEIPIMAASSFMPMILHPDTFSIGRKITWDSADISNLIGAISLAFWLCNGIPLVYEIYSEYID